MVGICAAVNLAPTMMEIAASIADATTGEYQDLTVGTFALVIMKCTHAETIVVVVVSAPTRQHLTQTVAAVVMDAAQMKRQSPGLRIGNLAGMQTRTHARWGNNVVVILISRRTQMEIAFVATAARKNVWINGLMMMYVIRNATTPSAITTAATVLFAMTTSQFPVLKVLPGAPGLTWTIALTLPMMINVVVMKATHRTHKEIA